MDELTRKYYSEYLEFEKYLEFRIIDYTKKFKGTTRNLMFSKYASNIQEVEQIINTYGHSKQYNVYVGSNCRPIPGKADSSVKLKRTFFFDIEKEDKKPPYSDKEYYKQLMETAIYIKKKLAEEDIKVNMLKESGRGFHLGVKMMPLPSQAYDIKFKMWVKLFIEKIEDGRPHKDIKFSDNMSNASRIESAPGTKHMKYEEQPLRRVLFLETHQNNMLVILNRMIIEETQKKKIAPKFKAKYTDITIYRSPEFLLLYNHRNLPEGEIHNKIIAMLKCLVRDYGLNALKMQMKLQELGYNEVIDEPHEDMVYSPWVLYNWCMRNYVYCYDNNVEITYPFDTAKKNESHTMAKTKYVVVERTIIDCDYYQKIEDVPITTYKEMLNFIRHFNKVNARWTGDTLTIFNDELQKQVKRCSNEKLYKFIVEKKHLWDNIKWQFTEDINDLKDRGIKRLY